MANGVIKKYACDHYELLSDRISYVVDDIETFISTPLKSAAAAITQSFTVATTTIAAKENKNAIDTTNNNEREKSNDQLDENAYQRASTNDFFSKAFGASRAELKPNQPHSLRSAFESFAGDFIQKPPPVHLYWFLYRRRNKLLLLFVAIFCVLFYFYGTDHHHLTPTIKNRTIQTKKTHVKSKILINRDTYSIPEPCIGCPGENGQGVQLTAEESKNLDAVMKKEFFNLRASDKISLWRSIPDTRDQLCKSTDYPKDLPTASVVIVFKNERWSPVLR
ncbi:unnamed protein product, partial [Rotaria magnacalcarata]